MVLQEAPDEITVVAERRNCSGCNKLYSGGQGAIQFDVTVPRKNSGVQMLDCDNTFFQVTPDSCGINDNAF